MKIPRNDISIAAAAGLLAIGAAVGASVLVHANNKAPAARTSVSAPVETADKTETPEAATAPETSAQGGHTDEAPGTSVESNTDHEFSGTE